MVASNVRRDQFNLEESILGINQAPRMEEGNRVEVSFPRLSVTQIVGSTNTKLDFWSSVTHKGEEWTLSTLSL